MNPHPRLTAIVAFVCVAATSAVAVATSCDFISAYEERAALTLVEVDVDGEPTDTGAYEPNAPLVLRAEAEDLITLEEGTDEEIEYQLTFGREVGDE